MSEVGAADRALLAAISVYPLSEVVERQFSHPGPYYKHQTGEVKVPIKNK